MRSAWQPIVVKHDTGTSYPKYMLYGRFLRWSKVRAKLTWKTFLLRSAVISLYYWDNSSQLSGCLSEESYFQIAKTWLAWENSPATFREVAFWALAKRRLSNERRNFILMTYTTQILVVLLTGWNKVPSRHNLYISIIGNPLRNLVNSQWSVYVVFDY